MTRGATRNDAEPTTSAKAPASGPAFRWAQFAVVALVWGAFVGGGSIALSHYAMTEGAQPLPAAVWPSAAVAVRDPGRPTIVMFLHPKCPCSRASVGELARILADCDGRVSADVVFLAPEAAGDAWIHNDLWQSAEAIPGVRVSADVDGRDARRFDVLTSGETLFYDAAGRLEFAGGITAARGHAGDSLGRAAILSLILTGRADTVRSPVYGCALFDDDAERPS